jgi:hypothetical protein
MTKHKWVTESINAKQESLSVWPTQEELANKVKLKKFFQTIEKIGSDPRVIDVERKEHLEHKVVFIFKIDA